MMTIRTSLLLIFIVSSLTAQVDPANIFSPENNDNIQSDVLIKIAEFFFRNLIKSYSMLKGVFTLNPRSTKIHFKRQNFALKSSGARIVSSYGGVISPSSILSGDTDTYMSFLCQEMKSNAFVDFTLEEDIMVENLDFLFLESFAGFIKNFEVLMSITGKEGTWQSGGVFTAKKDVVYQSFVLEKGLLARRIKLVFLSVFDSPHFYCTITQVRVNGKTYMNHVSEQMSKRIRDEEKKTISKEVKKKIKVEEVEQMTHKSNTICSKEDESWQEDTCHPFEFILLYIKGKSSAQSGLIDNLQEEGPLNIYFDLLSQKIKQINKKNDNFQKELLKKVKEKEIVNKSRSKTGFQLFRCKNMKSEPVKTSELNLIRHYFDEYKQEVRREARAFLNIKDPIIFGRWLLLFILAFFLFEVLKSIKDQANWEKKAYLCVKKNRKKSKTFVNLSFSTLDSAKRRNKRRSSSVRNSGKTTKHPSDKINALNSFQNLEKSS